MSTEPIAGIPGVYGVMSEAVNAYILKDDDGSVAVIDTGLPSASKRILAQLEAIGNTPQDVKHILITHADLDHIGGLNGLVKATQAPVYASAAAAEHLQKRTVPPHLSQPMKTVAALVNRLMVRPVTVQHTVSGGDVLPIAGGMQVIATPGHTPDHVSFFWERERVLFVGDLLRNQPDFALTPERITWDMAAAHASARAVLALKPAVICVGHGAVWTAEADPTGIDNLLATLSS